MRIKNIIVGTGPLPSAIVLRPANADEDDSYSDESFEVSEGTPEGSGSVPLDVLPISVGTFDAACVARGVDGVERTRPMTHNLLWNVIEMLGGTLDSVSITRVEDTTFYATLDITDAQGAKHHIDARPSDAIATAVRAEVPILASEDVLERGGMPNFEAIERDEKAREEREFHDFVEGLTPEDFKASDQR